jgi:hypothetical protein
MGEKLEDNGTVHQLFMDFKKAYDSARREVLYREPEGNKSLGSPRHRWKDSIKMELS